jgi:hypothetical protein
MINYRFQLLTSLTALGLQTASPDPTLLAADKAKELNMQDHTSRVFEANLQNEKQANKLAIQAESNTQTSSKKETIQNDLMAISKAPLKVARITDCPEIQSISRQALMEMAINADYGDETKLSEPLQLNGRNFNMPKLVARTSAAKDENGKGGPATLNFNGKDFEFDITRTYINNPLARKVSYGISSRDIAGCRALIQIGNKDNEGEVKTQHFDGSKIVDTRDQVYRLREIYKN